MRKLIYDPEWLKKQRNLSYRQERTNPRNTFMSKSAIVARYARELEAQGIRVTHQVMRAMLKSLGRGYSSTAQAISFTLHVLQGPSPREKYPNSHRVQVIDQGKIKTYKSLNEAARAEGCSPESVRLWARSRRPNRRGQVWQYLDPAAQRSKRRHRYQDSPALPRRRA